MPRGSKWRKLRREIEARGYQVTNGGGQHLHVRTAEGKFVLSIALSPKDTDTCLKAVVRDLRRAGVFT